MEYNYSLWTIFTPHGGRPWWKVAGHVEEDERRSAHRIAWLHDVNKMSRVLIFFFFFWAVEQWSNSRRVNRWKPGRAKRPAAAVSEGTSIIRAVLSDIFALQWCCRCWIADGDNVFPQFMCPPYTVLVSCASWWHGPYNKGYDVCHYFAMHGLRFLSNNWMHATCCEARNTANPRIQGFTLSRATKANQLHQALFS